MEIVLEFMDANEQRAEIETNEKLRLYDDLAYHKMMNLFWAGFAVFMGIVAILSHVL